MVSLSSCVLTTPRFEEATTKPFIFRFRFCTPFGARYIARRNERESFLSKAETRQFFSAVSVQEKSGSSDKISSWN